MQKLSFPHLSSTAIEWNMVSLIISMNNSADITSNFFECEPASVCLQKGVARFCQRFMSLRHPKDSIIQWTKLTNCQTSIVSIWKKSQPQRAEISATTSLGKFLQLTGNRARLELPQHVAQGLPCSLSIYCYCIAKSSYCWMDRCEENRYRKANGKCM